MMKSFLYTVCWALICQQAFSSSIAKSKRWKNHKGIRLCFAPLSFTNRPCGKTIKASFSKKVDCSMGLQEQLLSLASPSFANRALNFPFSFPRRYFDQKLSDNDKQFVIKTVKKTILRSINIDEIGIGARFVDGDFCSVPQKFDKSNKSKRREFLKTADVMIFFGLMSNEKDSRINSGMADIGHITKRYGNSEDIPSAMLLNFPVLDIDILRLQQMFGHRTQGRWQDIFTDRSIRTSQIDYPFEGYGFGLRSVKNFIDSILRLTEAIILHEFGHVLGLCHVYQYGKKRPGDYFNEIMFGPGVWKEKRNHECVNDLKEYDIFSIMSSGFVYFYQLLKPRFSDFEQKRIIQEIGLRAPGVIYDRGIFILQGNNPVGLKRVDFSESDKRILRKTYNQRKN